MKGIVLGGLSLFSFLIGPAFLGAGQPQPAAATEQVLETFKIHKNGDCLLLTVALKEGQFPFLLDTGASLTVFDPLILKGAPKESVTVATPNGKMVVQRYEPPAAFLGKVP